MPTAAERRHRRTMELVSRLRSRLPGLAGGVAAGLAAGRLLTAGHSHLRESGWLRSYRAGMPVDAGGAPLPWVTYPAIRILTDRLPGDARVFEFGCGNSTRYFATRVARVDSVETDPGWSELVRTSVPDARVHLVPDDDLPGYLAPLTAAAPVDLVLVDGIHRSAALRVAPDALSPRGVIVLDDSNRPEYLDAIGDVTARGFRALDLVGLKPTSVRTASTTILYRDGNCLGL